MIQSKTYLKRKILRDMELKGKIVKAPALDMQGTARAGWQLVPNRAFKNIDPVVLAQLKPLPEIERSDYREYLRNNEIQHDF